MLRTMQRHEGPNPIERQWRNRWVQGLRVKPRRLFEKPADGGISLSSLDQMELDNRHFNSLKERSEEHTSELQSLMRISYAVFCLNKKTPKPHYATTSPTPHSSDPPHTLPKLRAVGHRER